MRSFRLEKDTKPDDGTKNGVNPLKIVLFAVAAFAVLGWISTRGDDKPNGNKSAAETASGANVYLVASKSFCRATGIDDAYSGDGHVTFYLTFKNSGGEGGTVSAVPVRHYDDGEFNESVLDEVEADVAANTTGKFHTAAMKYTAHSHEIV